MRFFGSIIRIKPQIGNRFKLEKFRFRIEIGRNWITNRVVDEWNRLSNHIVSAEKMKSFKRRLDNFFG